MYIAQRWVGDEIKVGDIRIVILHAYGNRVRLGIEAPKDVIIHRAKGSEVTGKGFQRKENVHEDRCQEDG